MNDEIKKAIDYFKEIDGSISFVSKPEDRQKSVLRTALAALRFTDWLFELHRYENDKTTLNIWKDKFNEFKAEGNNVIFDKEKLENLKIFYKKAVDTKQEQFTFERNEYLTSYAKYLIEYLESRLK
jgi:hypothetical protein